MKHSYLTALALTVGVLTVGGLALGSLAVSPTLRADEPAPGEKTDTPPEVKQKGKDADKAKPDAAAEDEAVAKAEPEIGAEVGNRVPQFAVETLDLRGEEVVKAKHDSHATDKVTVYLMNSETCPFIGFYEDRIRDLEKKYAEKGVQFVHLYPNKTETDDGKQTSHKDRKFAGPMVLDAGGKAAGLLKGKRTPELVACGKDGVIFFRGGIDDDGKGANIEHRYADDALAQHLAGEKVEVSTSKPVG